MRSRRRRGSHALAPDLRRNGLATPQSRNALRLVRSLDLERLRGYDTTVVLARLSRERGIGPWSVGVIAIEGLGRYDHGLVGDLGLVKLLSSLRGEWVAAEETAALLAPYEEWQGLAGQMLMLGWSRGLIPGRPDPDVGGSHGAPPRGFARSAPRRSKALYTEGMVNERKIAVLGAGKIGEALISGLLSSGWRTPDEITASSRRPERVTELRERYGSRRRSRTRTPSRARR